MTDSHEDPAANPRRQSVWRLPDFPTWMVGTAADSLGGSVVTLAIPLVARCRRSSSSR